MGRRRKIKRVYFKKTNIDISEVLQHVSYAQLMRKNTIFYVSESDSHTVDNLLKDANVIYNRTYLVRNKRYKYQIVVKPGDEKQSVDIVTEFINNFKLKEKK
jgi:hypothetical protein